MQKEASYYRIVKDGVVCELCPHHCYLKAGELGKCHVRQNMDGQLIALTYGRPCALNVDPVEKKPLYHFLPGSRTFSLSTRGCNLACKNCQNWEISQSTLSTRDLDLNPKQVVQKAIEYQCSSISYTYTDPTVYYEYALDIAKLAHQHQLKNIMVTAGYIEEAPLLELLPYVDAVNIDLKTFDEHVYHQLNGIKKAVVLRTLSLLKAAGVWFEITNLLIPGWTDDLKVIKDMCQWLMKEGFENVPLHFSRFHPSYQLQQVSVTPEDTINAAIEIAIKSGMNYVYSGNVPNHIHNHTFCASCEELLVERLGYRIGNYGIKDGRCQRCLAELPGIWGV